MRTVAVLNQKGGVGKTSLVHHLGGALADLGRRVLLVDYDPQASLTQGFLGPDEADGVPAGASAAAIASGAEPDPLDLVRVHAHGAASVRFVPGSQGLAQWNSALPFRPASAERGRLRRFLAELGQQLALDLVLVDCPPNLQMCAAQALAAADRLVIPTEPEDYGAQGLRPVLDFLARSAEEDNPGLALGGIVVNKRQARVGIHQTYEARLRAHYGAAMFTTCVPRLVGFAEAIAFHLPITWHDPRSNAAEAMRALAAEFLARVEGGHE